MRIRAAFTGRCADLTQASGETATGSQQTTFDAMTQFMGVMTDPFVAGRGDGAMRLGPTPFAEESDAAAYAPPAASAPAPSAMPMRRSISKAPPHAPSFDAALERVGGGLRRLADHRRQCDARIEHTRPAASPAPPSAPTIGSRPYTLAGFALAGGGTNFSVANGFGSGRSDLFQAGAFVRHTVGAAYISGALAYGWQDVTTDRTVTVAGIDRLRAQFNANAWSGRVEGGYRFVAPWVMASRPMPPASSPPSTCRPMPSSVVSGANTFALAYGAKSVTASRSELGLRTDKSFAMQDAILTLRGRAAWAHDFNTDRSVAGDLPDAARRIFVVNGAAQARDAALTTASAEMKWLNGFSLAATFEGEFSDVTRSYAGKGVVRYAW